ncbi:hypothetical protein EVAR_71879_1 [Eumeta japonica]|uniref:Uncharacterized protein n=1 Tax=Eumeta variegata TaxID=151549 RepID=A0A4C1TJ84_EUMVA|nr:hypothetical protein EVAR_71879_1 [Eumeta japonica]
MLEEKDKELKKFKSRKEIKEDDGSQREETVTKTEKSRDKLIEQLESKIKMMAEEMISSTKLMNKLTAEKEEERNPRKLRICCKTVELALKASNEKCQELSDMLQKAEEESCLKGQGNLGSHQSFSSLSAGKRLNIPDDVVLIAKNLHAKERNKENDR